MGAAASSVDLCDVEHLVIYVHGVGLNGHRHGVYLESRVAASDWKLKTKVYVTSANVGCVSYLTLLNTLGGIKSGGERILNELEALWREGVSVFCVFSY